MVNRPSCADKSCHNFEQNIDKHNCAECKIRSNHSAKYQHSQIAEGTLRNEDSRIEIGVLPAQKNHIIISNKASTNIIAHNRSSDQRFRRNAQFVKRTCPSVCRRAHKVHPGPFDPTKHSPHVCLKITNLDWKTCVWSVRDRTKYQHSLMEKRTLRSEDPRFEIGILPAEKSCHNFEQSSNKHNCTEWKLGSKHSAKHQHSQIEKRTLRSEDSRFEISIIPAEKPFHHDNFERIISKQNYFAEWKLRSTNSAKYLYSAFHTYGGGARDSAPCPCVMLKARDHQRR